MDWAVAAAIVAALLTVVTTEFAIRQRTRREMIEAAVLEMIPLMTRMQHDADAREDVRQAVVRVRVMSRRLWGRSGRRINLEAQDLAARLLTIEIMSLNRSLDLTEWYRQTTTWGLTRELFGGRDLTDDLAHWYGDYGIGEEKPPLYHDHLTRRGRIKAWARSVFQRSD